MNVFTEPNPSKDESVEVMFIGLHLLKIYIGLCNIYNDFMGHKARRRLGQNFLTNTGVAEAEAAHANGKRVLEIGAGRGMLTKRLCAVAKSVIAVEKDPKLYDFLDVMLKFDNLTLIPGDFFKLEPHEIDPAQIDIVIANIPYSLSSKTIGWLRDNNKEAVLCLQKEFVEHMMAPAGSDSYSRLSVTCALSFRIVEIMRVPRRYFRPAPSIDSAVIFMKPVGKGLSNSQDEVINLIMQHKKKTLKTALHDARHGLNIGEPKLRQFLGRLPDNERVFKMQPRQILAVADELIKLQKL